MSDLFGSIDCLFTKKKLPRATALPSMFILHRFMASEKWYAPFAAWASRHLRDPELCWAWWQTAMPRGRPPRLKYPAGKKGPKPGGLVERLMERHNYTREQAEDAAEIIDLMDKYDDFEQYFAVPLKKRREEE